jgi:large subunit ribosomal protein L13
MKTFSARAQDIERKWYLIDAENQVVGRVAEKAAVILRGKNKPTYTPHIDSGDNVIVINAAKAVFTGKKEQQKTYMTYSGFIGGEKYENARLLRARRPTLIIERAVKGMIPHNRLGRAIYRKLHVYAGAEHPHAAQNPVPVPVREPKK